MSGQTQIFMTLLFFFTNIQQRHTWVAFVCQAMEKGLPHQRKLNEIFFVAFQIRTQIHHAHNVFLGGEKASNRRSGYPWHGP